MKRCKEYEIELSAMLDGESDPATAVALMDHIGACESCREFYRELRSFQSLVDDMTPLAQRREAAPSPHRRWLFPVPRWAWGVAAALVIAVGSYAAGSLKLLGAGGGGLPAVQRTEVRTGPQDEHFLELASEVLRSDRRDQQRLYRLLGEIETNEGSGEAPVGGEYDDDERSENYNELFAVIGGRRVVN